MVSCKDGLLVEDIRVAGEAVVELLALAVFLTVPAIADTLDQHPPTLLGLGLATLAIPAVLVADAVHKRARRRGPRWSGPLALAADQARVRQRMHD